MCMWWFGPFFFLGCFQHVRGEYTPSRRPHPARTPPPSPTQLVTAVLSHINSCACLLTLRNVGVIPDHPRALSLHNRTWTPISSPARSGNKSSRSRVKRRRRARHSRTFAALAVYATPKPSFLGKCRPVSLRCCREKERGRRCSVTGPVTVAVLPLHTFVTTCAKGWGAVHTHTHTSRW